MPDTTNSVPPCRERSRSSSTFSLDQLNFLAVDVEMANSAYDSVIEVGAVKYCEGAKSEVLNSLVNYGGCFDRYATQKHKIAKSAVATAPNANFVYNKLLGLAVNIPYVLHHGGHEPKCFSAWTEQYKGTPLNCRWVDTEKLARQVWPEFKKKGSGLKALATHLGITFQHHKALEDAQVCALIFLEMVRLQPIVVAKYLQWKSR